MCFILHNAFRWNAGQHYAVYATHEMFRWNIGELAGLWALAGLTTTAYVFSKANKGEGAILFVIAILMIVEYFVIYNEYKSSGRRTFRTVNIAGKCIQPPDLSGVPTATTVNSIVCVY